MLNAMTIVIIVFYFIDLWYRKTLSHTDPVLPHSRKDDLEGHESNPLTR